MNFTTIQSRIRRNTKTNSNPNSYPIAYLTDDVNVAMDRVFSLIMKADGRWQIDDNNQTDLPIATTSIVSGQQSYTLAASHLDVTRVEIQDQSGTWHLLVPIDQSDVPHQALEEYNKNADRPRYYDKIGTSVFLYPTPNYAQNASLKLYFKRGPSYFVSSDTTKEPGFNALYHDLCVLWPSYDYCSANGLSNAGSLWSAIQLKEAALVDDYSHRSPDRIIARTNAPRADFEAH